MRYGILCDFVKKMQIHVLKEKNAKGIWQSRRPAVGPITVKREYLAQIYFSAIRKEIIFA
jgi:hypothetical protein